MRKKRILWICNHVTLMDAEVPLLQSLGFEVFVPKRFPKGSEFVSCISTQIYDSSLSISQEDLTLLNTVDFYEGPFSEDVIEAIQRNFEIAITAFYEMPLRLLVNYFPGYIFIRAFGLAGEATYWNVARDCWGQDFLDKMMSIRERLFFAAAYRNMLKVERNIFREHGVFLPLGLPDHFAERLRNGYTGVKRQILFVCPKICAVPYYHNIYKNFKKFFGEFPHVIAGKPFGKVNDSHLLGYLPREEFDRVFCESRVMYYHSTEARHLHYHPLEAMFANMPVVFMSAGMLGELTPKIKYPGAADSIGEARRKVKRILDNDKAFIKDVQDSQKELLNFFSTDYVRSFWIRNFLPLVSSSPKKSELPIKRREHIALILPIGYRGGTLHAFICIANMLYQCGYRVTVGIPHDYFELGEFYFPSIQEELDTKLNQGILKRIFMWKVLTIDEVHALRNLGRSTLKINTNISYALMDDNIGCFGDCDRWLFLSDRFSKGAPYPLKPYSVMVYDYLQRYLPFQMFPENLENMYLTAVRQAQHVFVTNTGTYDDVVNYCGIHKNHLSLMPFEFSSRELKMYEETVTGPRKNTGKYIVWACNRAWHKNHIKILNAILQYYQESSEPLDIFITGVGTEELNYRHNKNIKFLPQHILDFRNLFKKHSNLLKNKIHFMGEMERYAYFNLVRNAELLLLSSLADNGAFGAVEAAWLKTPCACSDYPQMRYMARFYHLDIYWYQGQKISSIVQMLKINDYRKGWTCPSRELLEELSYENQQKWVSKCLREAWL